MSSQRRINSSRANGARSRGPKTPEGLARCQAAPLTHGFCARQPVLPTESDDDYRALRDMYLAEFQPNSAPERGLVNLLADSRWRLERLSSVEADLYHAALARQDPNTDGDIQLAVAFRSLCDESNAFANLDRYAAHLIRTHQAALDALNARRATGVKFKNRNRVPIP